jgi:exosortase
MSPAEAAIEGPPASFTARQNLRAFWPLAGGYAVICALAIQDLARQSWNHDFGAYGPIVMVTGAWLLWRRGAAIRRDAQPGSIWLALLVLVPSLAGFALGRALDVVTLETAGVFGAGLALFYSKVGHRVMLREWFPLLYLAFVVPPPGALLADLTEPLKQLVSHAATAWLSMFGVPVSREGVTIFVAQYQLLVEDACSGMNSIVGLTAVSLLYIYLVRGSNWVYSLLLIGFVIPIAIFANICRIMVLILLTYFFGNEVAQGYLHFLAGIFLFSTAILFVFTLDRFAGYALRRFTRSAS